MATSDNTLAAAALAVALVALLTTIGQLLQQYFGTAEGYRRCQSSVVGPWAKRTRLKFRWSEFRFETLFTVPHILLARTTWVSPEIPKLPRDNTAWIIGRASDEKDADSINLLVSGQAEAASELVTWLRFLRSTQWTHKRMLFKLGRVTESLSEKNNLALDFQENRKLTIPMIVFEERSWDFMPPDVVKPYARINIGDLGVLARRLGMEWERFEPSDGGILRASGNGYSLSSVHVRSVGIMVEFTEILGIGAQDAPIPWSTPVLPQESEKKTLLIPCAAADKMAFGVLPGVGSDFFDRDFNVSSLDHLSDLLRYFTTVDSTAAQILGGVVYDSASLLSGQADWHPGVADLLSLMSPMMYSPSHGLMGVPAPDNGLLFHGITFQGAACRQFETSLRHLMDMTKPSPGSYIFRAHMQIERFSYFSEWFGGMDWLSRFEDTTTDHWAGGRHPQQEFYSYYRSTTDQLVTLLALTNLKASHRRPLYFFLVGYHLRYMYGTLFAESGSPRADCVYPSRSVFPHPSDLWAERVKVTFIRLTYMVNDMASQGLGDPDVLRSAWVVMMIRGMCWNRCHTLIYGKTVPIQYCGSQIPVYLG